ncbi:hypothetical protein ACFCXP_28395 [Streptomyces niveus]|uniref:hypothetical protein n=1 Tax=Streptomyces niveus TaxID=193462 RepID=UPI0035D7F154
MAASNSGDEVYAYFLMVEFTHPAGKTLAVAPAGIFKVSPGATKSGDFTFAEQVGKSPSGARHGIAFAAKQRPA